MCQIHKLLHSQCSTSYQDEDVSLSLLVKVVGKLRQLAELDFVVSEIFLILHVVNVSVLNVLHGNKKNAYCMGTSCTCNT